MNSQFETCSHVWTWGLSPVEQGWICMICKVKGGHEWNGFSPYLDRSHGSIKAFYIIAHLVSVGIIEQMSIYDGQGLASLIIEKCKLADMYDQAYMIKLIMKFLLDGISEKWKAESLRILEGK